MAKLIIVSFFVVGVLIYSALRYAKVGIAAAKQHVAQQTFAQTLPALQGTTEPPLGVRVAGAAAELLFVQKSFIQPFEDRGLPDAASDHWSCGYIFGVCDCLQQRSGVTDEDECLGGAMAVFAALFGREPGRALALRYLRDQAEPEGREGANVGGREALEWLRDSKKRPMGWYLHTREKEKAH